MTPKRYLKIILTLLAVCLLIGGYVYTNVFPNSYKDLHKNLLVNAKTNGKEVVIKIEKDFEKINIKGVNLGTSKPGYFPNEFAITKDGYLRWFKEIYSMNANVIRIYIIASPEFYEAFSEFNKDKESKGEKPLYLIHGVWINEEDVQAKMNIFDLKIKNKFIRDVKETIDIIHGRSFIPPNKDYANGRYTSDISKYVLGYIFGIEWDGVFAELTNLLNDNNTSYKGKYLYTADNTNALERFLTEIGDMAIKYETENYNEQRLVSFANWPATDAIEHKYKREEYATSVTIDMEKIKPTNEFKSGLFASYNVYPYYLEHLHLNSEYKDYKDELGRSNDYRAYLEDINKHHSMPVIIAGFGLSTSRGIAHIDSARGYNHGHLSEEMQAKATVDLYKDIMLSGCSGAIVFSWQDEWYKKSWYTRDLININRNAYWHNLQISEQSYGILAFDQGDENRKIPYPDGETSEWENASVVTANDEMSLSMLSDEKYLYMKIYKKGFNIDKDEMYISLDTTPKSGSKKSTYLGLEFDRNVDFVVRIKGKDRSKVYVHDYYNPLSRDEDGYPETEEIKEEITSNSDKFNRIYTVIRNKKLGDKKSKENIPVYYETGALTYGNANINVKGNNTLSDFYISGNNIEIRIPWQLINFSDPSKKAVLGDIRKLESPKDIKIRKIYAGLTLISDNKNISLKSGSFGWKNWNQPKYHERLKPIYYSLQEAFKK